MSALTVDIRAARLNRGLSIRRAAKEMGLTDWKALQRAEGGQSIPHPPNAHKIASYYGYQVTDIWPTNRDLEPAA